MATYRSYASSMAERKLTIEEFTGVDQTRGLHSMDYGSSPDGTNFRTRDGMLMTVGGVSKYGAALPENTEHYPPALSTGRLFQGFFNDSSGSNFTKLVAVLYGRVYVADPDAESWFDMMDDLNDGQLEYDLTNNYSVVNYRHENDDRLFLINNNSSIFGATTSWQYDGGGILQPYEIKYDDQAGSYIRHAGKVALYKERMWIAGNEQYPDRVYWSNAFDPDDWEMNFENSEFEGAGYVDVATFDGSAILAMKTFMDDLLIFKTNTIHRLSGSYPGEFAVTQIFGAESTFSPRTIVDDGHTLYFLTDKGLAKYSGMTVNLLESLGDKRLKDIWSRINNSTINRACAAMMGNIIYLAVPLDGSIINTHVIEYNTTTFQYNILELPGVDDWLVLREGQMETLLYLCENQVYKYDSGYTFYDAEPINAVWTTPYLSCGSLASKKQTGRIYMSINATSLDINRQPSIKLTMLSGDKVRSKIIPLKNGMNEIRKRVKIRGRTFRLKIENQNGDPLTINKGVEIHVEEDFD